MKDFTGKIAVITGAANGIGKGLARHAVEKGCKVVLADIEKDALSQTADELIAMGGTVLPVVTDVSNSKDVEKLAQAVVKEYGKVHLLFNNAGVGINGPRVWERTLADWEWVLGVNLWGVIHGLHYFIPIMMSQDEECHIVNTASAAGLMSPPGMSSYNVSKHGVVTLSETMYHELAEIGSKIKVSVFCPGLVNTRMMTANRNRHNYLRNEPEFEQQRSLVYKEENQEMQAATEKATTPQQVAEKIFEVIAENQFYIFTHQWVKEGVKNRLKDIVDGKNPTNPAG